ncbi:MAG: hypothetical protein QOF96_2214, partial [Actinomycetota bacterium]|nr:hypothetical protein [Actinomycetota bacterium]
MNAGFPTFLRLAGAAFGLGLASTVV